MNRFDELYVAWKKLWDIRIVENEHLCDVCFLELLSTINDVRYLYGGKYKFVNLSSLKVQQSGTGKGIADGLVAETLQHLGYNVTKLQKFTEAAMVGTVYDDKGKSKVRKGAFDKYDFIWIDEARTLVNPHAHTEGFLEIVNGLLDDGVIRKFLAKGEIMYHSNCVFGTGTFFFEGLKPTIMQTGLFQRCLFTYKDYSLDDISSISLKADALARRDYLQDTLPALNEIKRIVNNINLEKYQHEGANGVKKSWIKMTNELSIEFGANVNQHFEDEVYCQVQDQNLKDILSSFLMRSKEIGYQAMCLFAVVNGFDAIDSRCQSYGIAVVKDHMNNIIRFLSAVFEHTKFDTSSISNEGFKRKKLSASRNAVIEFVKNNPGTTKQKLKDYIKFCAEDDNLNRKFLVGRNTIMDKLLPELIREKRIKVMPGNVKNQQKLYSIDFDITIPDK